MNNISDQVMQGAAAFMSSVVATATGATIATVTHMMSVPTILELNIATTPYGKLHF